MAARLRRSGDDGAALIEFGIMLPVLLGIFLGIVTAGLAFFARLQVTTAAQEGARVLYTGGTASEAVSAAQVAAAGTAVVERLDGSTWVAVPSTWRCPSVGNPRVRVVMNRSDMFIRFIIAPEIPVPVHGRGVTTCA